ncbi:hypothetical protein FD33_GL000571 [Companilactobacillus paralimentarius DSM 13238 = JCM 10415]|uniref:Uncharacterized protein n=2 Tax=Companilactobacillus paralimentarius TaxID=83526 RepID=A0A0R1PIX7_9LACO|nr:hypothetical protein FD33_GL000571 [Companilactobacillus paralimentarius DSM 13238 = JCM 10415]
MLIVMNISNVEMTEICGGLLLLVMIFIIILLVLNDLIRKRMEFACKHALANRQKIDDIALDEKTSSYLKRNNDHELHRLNEYVSKQNDVIRYKLYLKKRRFDFYLEKQNLWNYKVIAIKMYE